MTVFRQSGPGGVTVRRAGRLAAEGRGKKARGSGCMFIHSVSHVERAYWRRRGSGSRGGR